MTGRVLFLAQRTPYDDGRVSPHGSGAHVAATLFGLREHFDVRALFGGEVPAEASAPLRALREWVPARLRGTRQDAQLVAEGRRFARRALEAAAEFGPDVIYERSEYFTSAGLRLRQKLGCPLVIEVNGLVANDARTMYRSLAEPFGAALERRKLGRAEAVVTVSPGLARRLHELGAPSERTFVVPNTIDPTRVVPAPRPVRVDSAVVGWIGHMMDWHVEALEFLVDAAPAVLERVPAARFEVIGGGPRFDELVETTRTRGLAHAFTFHGPVPYETVPGLLAGMDVGVIPAIFDYAFPVKLVEMGAAGIPVVSPRSSSLDELLRRGEYEPFEPLDRQSLVEALVGVLADPGRRERLGAALHAAVRDRFTWHASGDALAAVVEQARTRSIS